MQYFAHAGLAMATSISAWLSAAIFAIVLKTRNLYSPRKQLLAKIVRIILAATVMGLGLIALRTFSGNFAESSSLSGICVLLLLIFCGGFIYFISLFLFNGISKEEIVENLKRWSVRD
jgi:putative peptidoglycan lipid II flippase